MTWDSMCMPPESDFSMEMAYFSLLQVSPWTSVSTADLGRQASIMSLSWSSPMRSGPSLPQ